MSRAVLMVDNGDGRVKCAKQFGTRRLWAEYYFAAIPFGAEGRPVRGWLVECANAKEGRFVIAKSIYHPEGLEHLHGRILAS